MRERECDNSTTTDPLEYLQGTSAVAPVPARERSGKKNLVFSCGVVPSELGL